MERAAHYINDFLDFWNALPGHWYYVAGVVVASIAVSPVVIEVLKRLHFRWTGVEMTNHLIDFTVWITGVFMALADFVITNGQWSNFLPFLAAVAPTIKALAPSIYTYSKAVHNWFILRENETQKQRLGAVLESADKVIAAQPATSFGTAANGITVAKADPGVQTIQL